MKKTYMIPVNKVVVLDLNDGILSPLSGLGREYRSGDQSYAKRQSFWDDEEDEEW